MRERTKFRPGVESVESRTYLSGLQAVAAAASTADVSPAIYPPPLIVSGTARGVYGPLATGLRGTGEFLRMGQARVQGQFAVQQGQATLARVVLSNRQGMVEIELTRISGSVAPGQTSEYRFRVTRATGSHAELNGTEGYAELSLSRLPRRGAPTFSLALNPFVIA